jgi:hypothetical protein
MDRVRVLGRGLQRLQLGRRGAVLLGREQLRVLVLGRHGRGFLARRPEGLRLFLLDLSFAGAVGALELEVLAYRVVEDPHVGPD